MTDKQKEAFENLQRIAMDHVRIAAAIDRAIQEIKREMNNLTPDYARLLVTRADGKVDTIITKAVFKLAEEVD